MPIDVKMPQLGESVTEGTIGRWLKQPGDAVEEFEALLDVTTDKVDTEVPALVRGTVAEILVPAGETVPVGTVIARLTEAVPAPAEGAAAPPAGDHGHSTPLPAPLETPSASGSTLLSPAVARLAREHGLNLDAVRGTGSGGRVTKKDVESFLAQRSSTGATPAATSADALQSEAQTPILDGAEWLRPQDVVDPLIDRTLPSMETYRPGAAEVVEQQAADADDELIPLTPMRRAIAQHMVRSVQIAPHVTSVMEVALQRVVAHRDRLRNDFERQGVKLTFTPYFVEAVVAALREVPVVNSSWADDGIVRHHRIHIGLAVAIPDGLLVPVLRDADDMSLLGLARSVNELAARARLRRVSSDELKEGTFSITNHGTGGSLFATPIINQPQVAILGIGAIQKRAVVVGDAGQEALAIRAMCYLSLTFDHRVIDGATGDAFLTVVKRFLETYV